MTTTARSRRILCVVGQAFQPDVSLDRLTYNCAVSLAGGLRSLLTTATSAKMIQLPKVVNQCGQRLAFDILHRVKVDAALAADREDRHDIRVVQLGGGLGLDLKPAQLLGIERGREGEHLERHLAVERDLLGLEDDAHAAAANHAQDAEVAQAGLAGRLERGINAGPALDLACHLQHRKAGQQPLCYRRVRGGQGSWLDGVAGLDRRQVGIEHPGQLRTCDVPDSTPLAFVCGAILELKFMSGSQADG